MDDNSLRYTLIEFMAPTHAVWSRAFNLSVMPYAFAICYT